MSKKITKKEYNDYLAKARREYGPDLNPTYIDAYGVERWKSNGKRVYLRKKSNG